MPPISVRVTLNWVFRLMAMPKSHSFSLRWAKSVKSSSMPSITMPALLTSTSIRPWQETASATAFCTSSIFVRSAVCDETVKPSLRSSSAQSWTRDEMSTMASVAPSRPNTRAVLKPMLLVLATPVMRAALPSTLPLRSMLMTPLIWLRPARPAGDVPSLSCYVAGRPCVTHSGRSNGDYPPRLNGCHPHEPPSGIYHDGSFGKA
jgi:hypothetical protein